MHKLIRKWRDLDWDWKGRAADVSHMWMLVVLGASTGSGPGAGATRDVLRQWFLDDVIEPLLEPNLFVTMEIF